VARFVQLTSAGEGRSRPEKIGGGGVPEKMGGGGARREESARSTTTVSSSVVGPSSLPLRAWRAGAAAGVGEEGCGCRLLADALAYGRPRVGEGDNSGEGQKGGGEWVKWMVGSTKK
jgi:hypothetical protein